MPMQKKREQLKTARFEKGILTTGTLRWLIFPSDLEYRFFELGEEDCIDLQPEPFEVPVLVGDYVEYCGRRFHYDPAQPWQPGTAPNSLSAYFKSDELWRAVWKESDLDTEERASEDFYVGNRNRRRRQLQLSSIPTEWHEWIRKEAETKFPEDIKLALEEKGINTSHSTIERLPRRMKQAELTEANRVQVVNKLAADDDSFEATLARVNHLLELAQQAIADQNLEESEQHRKLALAQYKVLHLLQRRIERGENKLLDLEMLQEAQARRSRQEAEGARPEPQPAANEDASTVASPASSEQVKGAETGTVTLRGAAKLLSLVVLFGALAGVSQTSLSTLERRAHLRPAAAALADSRKGDLLESRGITASKRPFTNLRQGS